MTKTTSLFTIIATTLCTAAHAATLPIPTSVVLGIDSVNIAPGPTFTVSGNFNASDFIDIQASGTIDLDSGDYTANAAGVLVSPGTSDTGSHPGQTSPGGSFGYPYAALLLGNSTLGFFPVFPADAADGLGNSTPPTTISVDETLGAIFGGSVSIPNGTVLQFQINDIDNYNNSGAFTVGNGSSSVPDAGATSALLGLSLLGLGTLRRKLA
jgi:hypothetical protein